MVIEGQYEGFYSVGIVQLLIILWLFCGVVTETYTGD